jgi:hypothetical protein
LSDPPGNDNSPGVLKIYSALTVLVVLASFSGTAYARCISCEAQLAPPWDDIIVEQQTSLSPP